MGGGKIAMDQKADRGLRSSTYGMNFFFCLFL
jgi:hypothetical protein